MKNKKPQLSNLRRLSRQKLQLENYLTIKRKLPKNLHQKNLKKKPQSQLKRLLLNHQLKKLLYKKKSQLSNLQKNLKKRLQNQLRKLLLNLQFKKLSYKRKSQWNHHKNLKKKSNLLKNQQLFKRKSQLFNHQKNLKKSNQPKKLLNHQLLLLNLQLKKLLFKKRKPSLNLLNKNNNKNPKQEKLQKIPSKLPKKLKKYNNKIKKVSFKYVFKDFPSMLMTQTSEKSLKDVEISSKLN